MADDKSTATGPQTGSGPAPRQGRGMRWLLIASLALNLLVAGIVVGALFDGPRGDRRPPGPRDAVAPYTRALEAPDRRKLRRELRRAFLDRRGQGDVLAAPYRDVIAILRADPFDASALRDALAAQAAAASRRHDAGREVLTRHIAAMSAAERQAYTDRLEAEVARLAAARKPGWRPRPPEGRD